MNDNDKEIIIHYDLDEYIENIINGLSDEECQDIINSVNNGYFSGIVTPKHLKKILRNSMHEMILNNKPTQNRGVLYGKQRLL